MYAATLHRFEQYRRLRVPVVIVPHTRHGRSTFRRLAASSPSNLANPLAVHVAYNATMAKAEAAVDYVARRGHSRWDVDHLTLAVSPGR